MSLGDWTWRDGESEEGLQLAHLLLCQEWPVGSHGAPAGGFPPKCHSSNSNSIYYSLL